MHVVRGTGVIMLVSVIMFIQAAGDTNSADKAFYDAVMSGNTSVIQQKISGYSLHALKKVLRANKVSEQPLMDGGVMVHDGYESFATVLERVPSQAAQHELKLLLSSTIMVAMQRAKKSHSDVQWLTNELTALKKLPIE